MRRGEKKAKPPKSAATIFAVVDLLPPGLELPNLYKLYEGFCTDDPDGLIRKFEEHPFGPSYVQPHGLSDEDRDRADTEYEIEYNLAYGGYHSKALEVCVADLPSEFVDYLQIPRSDLKWLHSWYMSSRKDAASCEPFESFLEYAERYPRWPESYRLGSPTIRACQRYDQARLWYIRLYSLAQHLGSRTSLSHRGGYLDQKSWIFQIQSVAVVNGRISFEPDEFTEAFLGLQAERIRLCKNCGRVFWAKRQDMNACSVRCAKVLRTRRWREEIPHEQKQEYYTNRLLRESQKEKH